MLDGLRREFPEVASYARRIPSPRVARTPFVWSVVAAFGAGFFVTAVVLILSSFLLGPRTNETPLPAPFEVARFAGVAAGLAVAWTAGRRWAVGGYAGVLILQRLLALPSQVHFCAGLGPSADATAPGSCSALGYMIALWPQLLGIALAFALVRWLRAGAGNRNPTLEAAGVFALVQILGFAFVNASLSSLIAGSPLGPALTIFVAIAAGVACGYTALRRATRPWRTLGIVALPVAAEFAILSLPLFVSQILQARGTNLIGPFELMAYFSPVFAFGAAALVLYMASARRVAPRASA
jgi:hypothetical protein